LIVEEEEEEIVAVKEIKKKEKDEGSTHYEYDEIEEPIYRKPPPMGKEDAKRMLREMGRIDNSDEEEVIEKPIKKIIPKVKKGKEEEIDDVKEKAQIKPKTIIKKKDEPKIKPIIETIPKVKSLKKEKSEIVKPKSTKSGIEVTKNQSEDNENSVEIIKPIKNVNKNKKLDKKVKEKTLEKNEPTEKVKNNTDKLAIFMELFKSKCPNDKKIEKMIDYMMSDEDENDEIITMENRNTYQIFISKLRKNRLGQREIKEFENYVFLSSNGRLYITVKDLHKLYINWCIKDENGDETIDIKIFSKRMRRMLNMKSTQAYLLKSERKKNNNGVNKIKSFSIDHFN
jgi:hypothetical protein